MGWPDGWTDLALRESVPVPTGWGEDWEGGIADSTTTDPRQVVEGADLVMLCTPLGAYGAIAEAMAAALKPGCIVSDVGSVKQCVIRDVAPLLPEGVHLVPAHPMAGTEHSGPEAGFAELFEGRYAILTPPPGPTKRRGEGRRAVATGGHDRSRSWSASTMTGCSPSSRTCRT